MSATQIPHVVIQSSSGHRRMLVIGFGTASNVDSGNATKVAAITAIKLGYRHFDTAAVYGSEQALGEAIVEALQLGFSLEMSSLLFQNCGAQITILILITSVSLRWLYEQGVAFAVKSYNKERMKQNLEIFDWSLTQSDYEKISQVKQRRINNGPTATPIADILMVKLEDR